MTSIRQIRSVPALLLAALAAVPAPAYSQASFGGRALVIRSTETTHLTTHHVTLGDTGELEPDGGPRDAALIFAANPEPVALAGQDLEASASSDSERVTARAQLHELSVGLPGLSLSAGVVTGRAEASCEGGEPVLRGGAQVTDLVINGVRRETGPQPNQLIAVPGVGAVAINEQARAAGAIGVNALRVQLFGDRAATSAEIVVSHARANVDCDAPTVAPASGRSQAGVL